MADVQKQSPGVWVCGTDTGIGKTVVSAGLSRALSAAGCRVVALKPVVSGAVEGVLGDAIGQTGGGLCWEDLERLALGSRDGMSPETRSVLRLRMPAAPVFAARAEGAEIVLEALRHQTLRTAFQAEFAVVEGVGGVRVPLGSGYDTSHLARVLGWPAVLVVGLRLGCINHALMSAEVLAARGIPLLAWVANAGVDAAYGHVPETIEAIAEGLGQPCASVLPALPGGRSPRPGESLALWRREAELQVAGAAAHLAGLAGRCWSERGSSR